MPSIASGVLYAILSGVCNGLFTAPMKVIPRWRWENIWLVFIVTSCLAMPLAVASASLRNYREVLTQAPPAAVNFALWFGFAWGFGAILFGLSVHRLGVSVANSLVIGLSSALGSLVPLALAGELRLRPKQLVLFTGVLTFLAGVTMCGAAGRMRDRLSEDSPGKRSWRGYLFATGAGVMSAVFNIGYVLAQPIADAGQRLGHPRFLATNCIWLLMLGAGSLPNVGYCTFLLLRNNSAGLFFAPEPQKSWGLSMLMGLLWGGSIFLYGKATLQLGAMGPSIGWPMSLATALLVANLLGFWLGEWRQAGPEIVRRMRRGIIILLAAVALCGVSATLP
jgi:L-rhamnose-H+ transport protein